MNMTYLLRPLDHREVTVAAYMSSSGRALRFPQLPCVDVGSAKRPALVPLELCT